MISAVVLTRNEEECIEKCLRSLAWCDEILVIDDFSKDRTVGIATGIRELMGIVRVIENKSQGSMAEIRNFALEKAKSDWVVFVDADEIVPASLAREIEGKIAGPSNQFTGYLLPRKDFFFGKFLNHGETGKIRLLRLAKRTSGSWTRGVHETWQINGEVGELENYLEHYSHRSISQFVNSINRWTDLDSIELLKEGKHFSVFRVFANPLGKFCQNYLGRLGFLDGLAGFIMAYMMSLQSLIVRVKQYELKNHDLSRTS